MGRWTYPVTVRQIFAYGVAVAAAAAAQTYFVLGWIS